MRRAPFFVLMLTALLSLNLWAAVITVSLPEFDGTPYGVGDPYPLPAVTVGTFTYSLPAGESIVAATLSSTFGNSGSATTAGVDYYLDGLLVAQCVPYAACWNGPGPNPWTFTFLPSQFALLVDGSAVMTAVQTNEYVIRTGGSTLQITTEIGRAHV